VSSSGSESVQEEQIDESSEDEQEDEEDEPDDEQNDMIPEKNEHDEDSLENSTKVIDNSKMICEEIKPNINSETEDKKIIIPANIGFEDVQDDFTSPIIEKEKSVDEQESKEDQEKTKKKIRKVIGDIHLKTKDLKVVGNDFCKTLYSFF
jgi:hypothetical protein